MWTCCVIILMRSLVHKRGRGLVYLSLFSGKHLVCPICLSFEPSQTKLWLPTAHGSTIGLNAMRMATDRLQPLPPRRMNSALLMTCGAGVSRASRAGRRDLHSRNDQVKSARHLQVAEFPSIAQWQRPKRLEKEYAIARLGALGFVVETIPKNIESRL